MTGADLLVDGRVPVGAGLSSSAALEVAAGHALAGLAGTQVEPMAMALLCQRAEHEYAGTRCGLMDQFIACFGETSHAVLLDCRSLEHRALELPAGVRIVIANSTVRHEHASGEYNARRAECEAAVRHFAERSGKQVRALRDVTPEDLERFGDGLSPKALARCRHVVSENARTLEAALALEARALEAFGRLLAGSHASLRDNYEVSCPELDCLVELAGAPGGVFGARMTGGGFGGCTVNLVGASSVERFCATLTAGYRERTGRALELYVCTAAEGAGEVYLE